MTAERQQPQPDSTAARARTEEADESVLDVAYEGDEYGDEEIDDLEDETDDEPAERRGWPLGALLLFALGIWVGRWVSQLPVNTQETVGLLLVIATAVLGAALYRRWVRKQMAHARARRTRR